MQNEFEKRVQQQLEGFSLTPADPVWEKVSARITREKKRRRLTIFWISTALLLVAGGMGVWLSRETLTGQKTNNKISAATPTNNKKQSSTSTSAKPFAPASKGTVVRDKASVKTGTDPDHPSNATTIVKAQTNTTEQDQKQDKRVTISARNRVQGNSTNDRKTDINPTNKVALNNSPSTPTLTFGNEPRPAKNTRFSKPTVAEGSGTTLQGNIKSPNQRTPGEKEASIAANTPTGETSGKPGSETENNSIQLNNTTLDSVVSLLTNVDTATALTKLIGEKSKTVSAPITTRRPYFGFTLTAGLSDNRTGFPVISDKALNDFSSAMPNNQTGGSARTDNPLTNGFSNSFSFGIGGFVGIKLNKLVAFTSGIKYHYYATGSAAGTKINSQRSLYDSMLNTVANLDAFYSFAPSNAFSAPARFTNSYHLLQVPVQVEYTLSKVGKRPIVAQAGLTPAVLLSTRALYFNRSANITYINRQQFKQFQLFANGGFQVQIANAKKLQYSIGPHIQYGLTNLTRQVVQSRQHLFYAGLQANIAFKK